MSDWEIVEALNELKLQVLERRRTDWPGTGFDHIGSMTCRITESSSWILPTWEVQLATLLALVGVILEG
jgi:hypothetical protein